MRRFLTLVCLLCLAIPAGISISGCTRDPGANYCNGQGYGMKIGDVASIVLGPATTGISLAYGQTQQVSAPQAFTCKGTQAQVGASYSYGTTNNQLVDITPSGNMCAGTWNRNTGGGIANYTICSPPNPLPSTGGLPYGVVYVTASAQSVVSNPVKIFVHAPVTSVSLVTSPLSGTAQKCFSQSAQATLDVQACYSEVIQGKYTNVLMCAPPSVTSSPSPSLVCPLPIVNGQQLPLASIPSCTAALGTLSYSVGTPVVGSILTSTTTNQVTITAGQPGTTLITASVAGSGSSAGYFSTCPPASISVTLANGEKEGTITQGVTQNLITTVTDTQGNPITGLSLDYQSTDPMDISAGSGGAIATSFPGVASVYAICQPPTCNPAPTNEIGLYGTGLPISSNPVTITTPGTVSDYVWFAAPGQSQYVIPVELISGTVGATVRLPYVPNSVVMDRLGYNLFFGSSHELMVFTTSSNSVDTQDTSVPGVVLAVSPDDQTVLINDQERRLFYLYSASSKTYQTFGGMGNAAAWTPDSKTLYVTDNASLNNSAEGISGHTDTLYVYNQNTGWTIQPLPSSPLINPLPPGVLPSSPLMNPLPPGVLPPNVAISGTMQTPAITIPSVGAYLRGVGTVAHTWCPTGTVGDYASITFYPLSDVVATSSDALAATTDGQHILGATALFPPEIFINDIGVTIPTDECAVTTNSSTGVQTLSALSTGPWINTILPLGVNATAVNQVVVSPKSNLAFVTYTSVEANTNAKLPYYVPNSSAISSGSAAPGTQGSITLQGSANIIAPLAGAFTPDDKLFFVSTAGDNMIHYIDVPTLTDKQQISPNLPACTPLSAGGFDPGCLFVGSGAVVPATFIGVKQRPTT
jgi:hypothetical protein